MCDLIATLNVTGTVDFDLARRGGGGGGSGVGGIGGGGGGGSSGGGGSRVGGIGAGGGGGGATAGRCGVGASGGGVVGGWGPILADLERRQNHQQPGEKTLGGVCVVWCTAFGDDVAMWG